MRSILRNAVVPKNSRRARRGSSFAGLIVVLYILVVALLARLLSDATGWNMLPIAAIVGLPLVALLTCAIMFLGITFQASIRGLLYGKMERRLALQKASMTEEERFLKGEYRRYLEMAASFNTGRRPMSPKEYLEFLTTPRRISNDF